MEAKQPDFPLPKNLPRPIDDGEARHLRGMRLPALVRVSTAGRNVDLTELPEKTTVIFCYPMTGVPGVPLPDGWDEIPGARGCTPQACAFRDLYSEFQRLDTAVFGLSTQETSYQREMAERLHLPYEVLSDSDFRFCDALQLPTFTVNGVRLVKRVTIAARKSRIEQVFYPVFPSNENAEKVLLWLKDHPA